MSSLAVEMRNITKLFRGVKGNSGVDFKLKKGSIHGLLGENGAGKTTLMNILYGFYQPEEGEIYIRGNREVISSPTKAISLGIGMVHQHFMLARPFSVVENVMLGKKGRHRFLLDTAKTAKELVNLSRKYKMEIDPYSKIWQLSVGEQQRVEILTALYMGADILILDEPTAVLTPQEVDMLFETLRKMRDDGKSIILITHKLEEIISVVDEVTVLRDGKLVGTKVLTPDTTKEELTRMMVGRDVLFDFPQNDIKPGAVEVSIQNLSTKNDKGLDALSNLSLDIHKNEILGLAGVDGNGQKELCEVLTGMRKADGAIMMDGENIINRNPAFYINKGIAHITEDRHETGLALDLSLKKNLVIKRFIKEPFSKHGFLNEKAITDYWNKKRDEYHIKSDSADEPARALSGGNQQKIVLARELDNNPSLVIANQPTRGLDIGASEYVRTKILEARNEGSAVLLISADLEEILQLSDRIAVIYNGRITGILPKNAGIHEIGSLMLGKKQEAAVNA